MAGPELSDTLDSPIDTGDCAFRHSGANGFSKKFKILVGRITISLSVDRVPLGSTVVLTYE
jgi:hypothetical protein